MKLRKILSGVVAGCMLAALMSTAVQAAETTQYVIMQEFGAASSRSFKYDYNPNTLTISIAKYVGKSTKITIPSEIDGYPVTGIADEAFKGCKKVTSITIPESVCEIGKSAFEGCTKLTKVNIPSNVSLLDQHTFKDCTSLKSIKLPDNLFCFPNAFSECKNLKITQKGSTTTCYKNGLYINEGKLVDCLNSMTSVTIPKGVTSIEEYAFQDCTKLTKITIPDEVKRIGNYAFDGCTKLAKVNMSKNIEWIGDYAFGGCTSLISIKLPNIDNINWKAFTECKNLKVTYKGKTTPVYKNGLFIRDGILYDCLNSAKKVTIPSTVKAIASYAFQNCTKITSIKLPAGIEQINMYTFDGCTSLKSVTIPSGVAEITDCAFRNCSSLTKVKLPDSVLYIDGAAFEGCTKLSSINIPDNLVGLSSDVFKGCTALKSIVLPDSVSMMSWRAFTECPDIIVTYKGETAPVYENGLCVRNGIACSCLESAKNIVIPDSVTSIDFFAFRKCTSLKSVTIPDSVTEVDRGAFSNCDKLTITYKGKTYSGYDAKNFCVNNGKVEL